MSNEIKFTNAKLWKNERKKRDGGKFYTYTVSVSKKMKDGSYKNKSLRLFPAETLPEDLPSGAVCDIEGFLTLDIYQGREGEVAEYMVYANEIIFHDASIPSRVPSRDDGLDSFEQLDEDVPF